jgi:hypothetical protein
MMTSAPSKESLNAYEAALGAACARLDDARNGIDEALEEIEKAKDEARSLYGTPEATSIFSDAISGAKRAAKAIADAIDALPALDEGTVE